MSDPSDSDDDESDEFVLHFRSDGNYYREEGARGRVNHNAMRKLDDVIRIIIRGAFGDRVERHYGGVYWGVGQKCIARTDLEHRKMFFNARVKRTPQQIFTDICHEWTHMRLNYERHDRYFAYEVEQEIARRLEAFCKIKFT